jgi:ornithine decarboxylase
LFLFSNTATLDAAGDALRALLEGSDENVYVYDLTKVRRTLAAWRALLPDVEAHYAVKCNPDPRLLQTLARAGCAFDCASAAEISLIMDLGVAASRIIYANPCKRATDLRYAAAHGVQLTTFDSLSELDKLMKEAPASRAVLRIFASDPGAKCVLSNKYGALEDEWAPLLVRAQELGVDLVGVSFHIGSGASNPAAFTQAIEQARKLHDLAHSHGFRLSLLDIGGGFTEDNMMDMAAAVNGALARWFPPGSGVRCISEPGRLFAETAASLYTSVIGARQRDGVREVTMTDSIYGSFNCIVNDHARPMPIALRAGDRVATKIFMESCDGGDAFEGLFDLPHLECGDRLMWPNMGAYTLAACSGFNGMPFAQPRVLYLDGDDLPASM